MRVAVVDTYYAGFLEEHYADDPGLTDRPYAEQLESLIGAYFGTSDAYSRYLSELGHPAIDIVPNCVPLQERWLEENGVKVSRRSGRLRGAMTARAPGRIREHFRDPFLETVAMAQIEAHEADVVYCQDRSFFTPGNLERLRAQGRFLVAQIATELQNEAVLRRFDLIFTSFPHYVERFRALGVDTEYLQIGFYSRVLDRLRQEGADPAAGSERPHRVVFAGGLSVSQHKGRTRLLERVASQLPLEFWGYGAETLPVDSALRRAHRGAAWGLDMYRVLADSAMVINSHGEVAEGYANNMRLFEATGCGAVLFTESAPNLSDFFEEGREVVSYDGPGDLMDKLRHYLEHDDERVAIAAAGQERTLRDHGYEQLMVKVAETLEARL